MSCTDEGGSWICSEAATLPVSGKPGAEWAGLLWFLVAGGRREHCAQVPCLGGLGRLGMERPRGARGAVTWASVIEIQLMSPYLGQDA